MDLPRNLSQWPTSFRLIGVPPLELLDPFLEKPSPVSGHQSWNGIDKDHPEADFYEKTKEAVYYWPWSRKAVDLEGREVPDITPARYPVVRVLFWYLRDARQPRTVIRNDCGIPACCNIDHWHVADAKECAAGSRIVVYTAFDSPDYRRER